MKYLLLLLIFFSGCDAGISEDDVYRIIAEESEIEIEIAEAKPVFIPEKLTLYIFNTENEIVYQETTTADNYATRYNLFRLATEVHNRDYPDDIWRFIGGGGY